MKLNIPLNDRQKRLTLLNLNKRWIAEKINMDTKTVERWIRYEHISIQTESFIEDAINEFAVELLEKRRKLFGHVPLYPQKSNDVVHVE